MPRVDEGSLKGFFFSDYKSKRRVERGSWRPTVVAVIPNGF